MSGNWESDPRYPKWQQVVKVWHKSMTHLGSDPIPIAPDEYEELCNIFGNRCFRHLDGSVVFGRPGMQKWVVIC